ncbi:MAG TPA: hypothetical protein VLF94_08525 [Chlamydiales bacterium]|nr:hypothetical protein [Chlamydiales bacterium]
MKLTNRWIATLLPLLLVSCSTSYQSAGFFGGGYSEIITANDSFLVTFKGNGYTSQEKVIKYALMRASELTLQNGYKYFAVVSSMDQTRVTEYSNTSKNVSGSASTYESSRSSSSYLNGYGSSSTYSGTIQRPGLTLKIKCYHTEPSDTEVINAEYYLAKNNI